MCAIAALRLGRAKGALSGLVSKPTTAEKTSDVMDLIHEIDDLLGQFESQQQHHVRRLNENRDGEKFGALYAKFSEISLLLWKSDLNIVSNLIH